MSTAVESVPELGRGTAPAPLARVVTDGKFLRLRAEVPAGAKASGSDQRFRIKGVTYGTFAPDAEGYQFPVIRQVAEDFRLMTEFGINTVRVYTPPRRELLDEAARQGLRVMVGLPWSQHVAFLDDAKLTRAIRREIVGEAAELADHPAVMLLAIGNEIPAPVVRWHGSIRVERFLRNVFEDCKSAAPDALFTYVNFPPTEFLDLSFFDICAFNVYLHREHDLRAYLARLQNIAGHKPLLLAEAGADSIREGLTGQAAITATHVRAAFEEGACGAIAFAWTDEWWRGGHPVVDWSFGLVDRERKPKPAALAVKEAFDNAPFSRDVQSTWPRVSVVVCAYNAADTVEDCLASLETLTYPDYEIILVNDGSRDRTSEIGHRHPRVRVLDIPNGGLSAARNVGLAAATGEIVAYTDADVCVDRDWLTFLVQPFLNSDVIGSGGPNVVPSDDPPMAQSIARAPGGPTHVLLDDRTAEHVPGCNMAFRREALLAIGGFNPIYLRAGDDVDVCWRLQARGGKIGFSGAALVWHHHRSSLKSYWRQQVGYGEGETWLMAHHPDKFLDGHMLWHGRIYSPLPFVRSLWGTRINAGVWGTAAFPSVYRTDVHPFAFLPHSIKWQVLSFVLTLAGILTAFTGAHKWAATLMLVPGLVGIAVTVTKNVTYALRSDIDSLPGSRLWYRATVAYLHFIQPIARLRGRIRGLLSPPEARMPHAQRQTSRGPRPSLKEALRALLLLSGNVIEDNYWSEGWTTADRVLAKITEWLRRSRAVRTIAIDEGWSNDRDVSVFVGRWAWLDIRALVEDHGGGKSLLRVSTHLRPTTFGVVTAVIVGGTLLVAASAHLIFLASRWPLPGAGAAVLVLLICASAAWRTAQTTAIVRRGIDQVALTEGMTPLRSGPSRAPIIAPSILRMYGLRSAIIFVVMIFALGASTLMLRQAAKGQVVFQPRQGGGPELTTWNETPTGIAIANNGTIYFADSLTDLVWRLDPGAAAPVAFAGSQQQGTGFSGDDGLATRAQLDTPDGVCIAPDGDVVIADSHNDRIRRVDLPTRIITTVAGSGENGYDGDDKAATDAALNTPNSVACAPNGNIYIADTLNNRIRMIDAKTGLIHTIAGDGSTGDGKNIGDGGPAVAGKLFMPSDVAIDPRTGDVYIADMHHNRIRRVDGRNHVITTVAGDGRWARAGDDEAAIDASLQGPAGIAVAPSADGHVTVFIAESYSGHVRAIGPDGIIRDLSDEGRTVFGAPSRVAFDARTGRLYVADSNKDQVVEMPIPDVARNRFAIIPRTIVPKRSS